MKIQNLISGIIFMCAIFLLANDGTQKSNENSQFDSSQEKNFDSDENFTLLDEVVIYGKAAVSEDVVLLEPAVIYGNLDSE